MKTLLALSFLLVLAACGKDAGTTQKSLEFRSEVSDVALVSLAEVDQVDEHLRNERVFRDNTPQERADARQTLRLIKASLLKLNREPGSKEALRLLAYNANLFNAIPLIEVDGAFLAQFKVSLNNTVARLARISNTRVEQTPWILFKTNFSRGLEDFVTFSTKGDWQQAWALDRSFARVRGEGNRSWLIAPPMNLSGVTLAKLRLNQVLNIDRASRFDDPFDRSLIINSAFKLMVSEDYVNGDPAAAAWQELKISGWPIGSDFHAKWSDEIDLGQFAGKRVSIALLYDMDARTLGRHFVTWQINEFQLIGVGENFAVESRPRLEKMYEHLFNQSRIAPYNSVSTGVVNEWVPFGFSGKFSFVKAEANAPGVDTFLISPKITLNAAEAPVLVMKEVIRNFKRANYKFLVSDSYDGSDPSKAVWTEIDHIPANFTAQGPEWVSVTSKEIDLSAFAGRPVNFAFRLISDDTTFLGWELESILIKGKGSATVTNQTITYTNPNVTPEIPVSNVRSFSFDENKDEWATKVIEGSPAKFVEIERNGASFLEISGFKEKNTGTVQLETALIQLPTKAPAVQLNQSLRFYEPKDRALELIQVLISKDDGATWTKLSFTKVPGPSDRNLMDTEWLSLEGLAGESVRFAFRYKTDATTGVFPSWQLATLRTGELGL